jgi:hypothetical protein
MRKVTWTTVGLVVLSMLLCGSGETDANSAELPADTRPWEYQLPLSAFGFGYEVIQCVV